MTVRPESASDDVLSNRIRYHKPSDEGIQRIAQIRRIILEASRTVASIVPEGREQSLAFTKLEESLFWANAGIARHPDFQSEE